MKKSKLILLVLLFFTIGFICTENINAEMTDEDCRACAERYGGRCGYCRACSVTDSGECVANKNLGGAEENAQIEQDLGGCSGYTYKNSCEKNKFYSCIWNINEFNKDGYCNTDKLVYVRCGDSFDIPHEAPKIISFLITLLKVAIPIILIFVAILSLLKAVGAANEDEIKKAQKSLVRKIVASVLAFFVITIVQFVIMKVADNVEKDENGKTEVNHISSCLSCFMNNDCDGTAYYKNNVAGKNVCYKLDGTNEEFDCPEYEDLTN